MKLPKPAASNEVASHNTPSFRSGAVARMIGMPVATLRVWERRYGVSAPELTTSGQRLYSGADVRRLGLLRQLTDRGHAISSLASLDMRQLQAVVATLFNTQANAVAPEQKSAPAHPEPAGWRVAVVGAALAERLSLRLVLRRIGRPVILLGVFDTPAQAAKALKRKSADLLLTEAASLQPGWLADLHGAAPGLKGIQKAVLYGFASEAVCNELDSQGVAMLRAPQPAAVLGQWLHGLAHKTPAEQRPRNGSESTPQIGVNLASNSRWSAEALASFARQASSIACECPQHLTELLTRLADFESYSIECSKQSAADAELHAYLRQTAASARAGLEKALERIALHEGLLLPLAGG
jgi:MerR family transcriptional regulator, light-induced transcriptional regulator